MNMEASTRKLSDIYSVVLKVARKDFTLEGMKP